LRRKKKAALAYKSFARLAFTCGICPYRQSPTNLSRQKLLYWQFKALLEETKKLFIAKYVAVYLLKTAAPLSRSFNSFFAL